MRFLAIGLGCLLALSAHAAPVSVENIRTWPAPDHTRIVLDIDRPVEYALFVLRDPDRVVVDLRAARLLKRCARRHGPAIVSWRASGPRSASVQRGAGRAGRAFAATCGWCST